MRIFQFSLAGCLGVFTVGSIFLFSDQNWLIALTATVATIYISAHLVTKNLPSGITAMMQANCLRLDGSVSNRRTQIEKKAAFRLKIDLFVALLTAFFPTAYLFWLFNAELIPFSARIDAISNIDFSQADIKSRLRDHEVAFTNWKQQTRSSLDHDTFKQSLLRYWATLIMFAVAWLAACCYFIRSSYFHLLKNLRLDVTERFLNYQDVDRSRFLLG